MRLHITPLGSQRMVRMPLPIKKPLPNGRGSDQSRDRKGAIILRGRATSVGGCRWLTRAALLGAAILAAHAHTIRFTDLSIDGADNGIRIKSNSGRGGKVTAAVYQDVCIRDTRNPIYMDSDYAHFGKTGGQVPWFTGIVLKDVRVQGAGKITLQGYDAQHPLGMAFDNVQFDSLKDIRSEEHTSELQSLRHLVC